MTLRIHTPRLELTASTEELARLEMMDLLGFSHALVAVVPEDWPPELNDDSTIRFNYGQLRQNPQEAGWWCWYMICREDAKNRPLIGVIGFKGKPDGEGTVEIGYSIMDVHRGRGYATEAVRGLMGWVFSFPEVQRLAAETLPHLTASIRVLESCGFCQIASTAENGVLRFEIERGEFEKTKESM